jgi:hypothetical protein
MSKHMKYILILTLLALTSCASTRNALLYNETKPTTLIIRDNHHDVIYMRRPVKGKFCVWTNKLGPGYTVQVGKHIDTIAGSNAISVDERAGIKAETAKVN